MDWQTVLDIGLGGSALAMLWQFKRDVKKGFAEIRNEFKAIFSGHHMVLVDHEHRLTALESGEEPGDRRTIGFGSILQDEEEEDAGDGTSE